MIYLDYNATTPIADEVLRAMKPFFEDHFGNPSSSHTYGRAARDAVDWARKQVAALIGAAPHEIYFTSGGTEASNIAIRGGARASGRRHLITSAIEHPATLEPCRLLVSRGFELDVVGVDAVARIDVDAFAEALTEQTGLVTVMHANNEVGTIQPVAELAEMAHDVGAVFHTDAAQSIGKIAVDVDELGVDFLTLAGHKLYAPKGVGALYVRDGTPVEPVLVGAGHEGGLRPGTENVPYVVGLGEACRLAASVLDEAAEQMRQLRDRLWDRLRSVDGVVLNGDPIRRLPNTLNVRFTGVNARDLLDEAELAASTGSACHDGDESPSAVLSAMGQTVDEAAGAIRLSLGRETSEEDVDRAAEALIEARGRSGWGDGGTGG